MVCIWTCRFGRQSFKGLWTLSENDVTHGAVSGSYVLITKNLCGVRSAVLAGAVNSVAKQVDAPGKQVAMAALAHYRLTLELPWPVRNALFTKVTSDFA